MCLWCGPKDEDLHGRLLAMKQTAEATYNKSIIAQTTERTKTEFLVGQLLPSKSGLDSKGSRLGPTPPIP